MNMVEEPTLFLEFHSSEAGLEAQTTAVAEIAKENGGSDFEWATKPEDRTKLWTARHKLHYASLNLKPGSRSVTTDVCVPISKLPEMVVATREDIDKSGITGKLQKCTFKAKVNNFYMLRSHLWSCGRWELPCLSAV